MVFFLTGCRLSDLNTKRDTVFIPYIMSPMPDPLAIVWSGDWAAAHHLWTTLVELRADGTPAPRLAKSWQLTENGKQWTFQLRPNLKWSDGTEMTVEQVVQSLNASCKGTSHTDLSSSIVSISTKDSQIVFQLKRPLPTLLISLSYIDWAILHPNTIDLSGPKPKLKSASPVSGQFTLRLIEAGEGPVQKLEFIKNNHSPISMAIDLKQGALAYYPDCETLVNNQERALGFRCFAESFSESCRKGLEAEFNILQLQPTWVISAQFTKSGAEHFSKPERQAIFTLLHKDIEKIQPHFGVQRATGLLPPHLFGALTEDEFKKLLNNIEQNLSPEIFQKLKKKPISLVTMDLWGKWESFKWLQAALIRLGLDVKITVLSRSEYFKIIDTDKMEQQYDLNFIPTGVGDPDPDGTWQTASKNFFPGLIDQSKVSEAFFEMDRNKRSEMYKNLARELLTRSMFLPFKFDSPYVGIHKSLKLGDVAPFRAGLTLYDMVPADH